MASEKRQQDQDQPESLSQRGIYLLPNLFTTTALFAGFYSLVAATKGYFDYAAIAIFVAMVADGLDGRIARMTNTQTPFGAQYDSLSDMAAFGIAPAFLIFTWSLSNLGKLGWLAAFLYAAGVALRLARFNTQVMDKQYFQGLPSPSGAGILAAIVWTGTNYGVPGMAIDLPTACLTIVIAALMVSTIRYSSFKSIDFKGRVPFFTIVLTVFLIAAVAMEPPEMLFVIFFTYLVSGPICTLWQLRKVRKQRKLENKRIRK